MKNRKNKNLIQSFNNAVNGIIATIRTERNMRIHILAAVLIIVLSFFYNLTRNEFIIICFTIALVLICELFNTAVEAIVDIIVNVYHPKARIIKDAAAGAVFVSALVSVLVGYLIFFEKISIGLELEIQALKRSDINSTVVALGVTIATVIIIKTIFKRGTPFRGGMPSGHSAIAFSITTAVALWLENITVTILFLLISLLLIQSRLEGKIHNLLELMAGAILGFLVTLLLFQLVR